MEDYDIFTNEIVFNKSNMDKMRNSFLYDAPPIPSGPNYQSATRLKAAQLLEDSDDVSASFYLSESVSASVRTMAVYREEQIKASSSELDKITSFLKPVEQLISMSREEEEMCSFLKEDLDELTLREDVKEVLAEHGNVEKRPLHDRYLRFSPDNNVDNFQRILKEFPKEWTVVQVTTPYNPSENLKQRNVYRAEIDGLYVSVLCNDYMDCFNMQPFTIQVPANLTKEGEKPLFVELYDLLDENLKIIDNAHRKYTQNTLCSYWEQRMDIDLRMKSVINVMDKEWLGGWKCLLSGKLEEPEWRDRVRGLVDKTCADWGFLKITPKQRLLLSNLLECSHHISSSEIRDTIRRILTEQGRKTDAVNALSSASIGCGNCDSVIRLPSDLCLKCAAAVFEATHHFTLVDGLKAFMEVARQVKDDGEWSTLRTAKRFPVILIVDEMLDTFPWESLPVLSLHPVSRIENLHFLYRLFKMHQPHMEQGYFVSRPEIGRYLINPANNLDGTEKRMACFVEYWCPEWRGECGHPPEPETLLQDLREADLFLYCGHGDGCQYAQGASGAGVEGVRGAGVALLTGCGSVRLGHAGGRAPPSAAHHHYHIAGSPAVVGMLWEVTDLEVNKVVSTLLSLYVPSSAPVPWESVGKAQWSQGVLDLNVKSEGPMKWERDLLRALAKARRSTNFLMISSSVVARGLPVRMQADKSST